MELARTAQKSIRFCKNILERLAKLVPLMPKSKNHTYGAEYPKTQLLFNILFFIKNLLKDFLPQKMLFLNIFWYCRFWNQKWNFRRQPKSVFLFAKTYLNVLQNLSRSCQSPKTTLTPQNIQKHNYFLTFLFFIKNLLKDFLPKKMLFLNIFWYCRFWNQKWNLREQPKSLFVFAKTYLNVLQNLSRSCQSPKTTLTPQNIQKHNYFLTFLFFIKNLLKDFLPKKMLFLNIFWYCRFWNQKWNLRGQPKSLFVFWKNILERLAKLVPLMPKSKNHTHAAEYPKTQLLFNIFI